MDIEKINKTCSNIFLIDERICLDDSLFIINTNFSNISSQITNLNNFYNVFENFYTLFETHSSKYFNTLSYLNQFSAKWDNAFEHIMKHKDAWNASPIFLLYPNLVEFNDWYSYNESVIDNVIHWLELYFPPTEYAENQSIKISVNLIKDEIFNYNFKKSYDEKCTVYNSNSKTCEKCNNGVTKACCTSNDTCVSKIKNEYVSTLINNYNTKNTVKSNEFDLNFLNTNFNIEYGAILKKDFIIKGKGKIGDIDVESITLNSDLKIDVNIDRIKKILYFNYVINSDSTRTITENISIKKEISPIRTSPYIIGYEEAISINEKTLNIYNSTPVSFGNMPSGKYRLKYMRGAMSHFDSGDIWCAVPVFRINKGASYIETTQLNYADDITAVDNAKNFYGVNKPWFMEFDHTGGGVSIQLFDSVYADNRALNDDAPTFKLVRMNPIYNNTGPNDGTYELITLTNPFNGPAEFTYAGTIDNKLYLNDVSVTDFSAAKTYVEKKAPSVIPVNGTVKLSIYTSQENNITADYAELQGVGKWYSINPISTEIGFEGNIEWYAKCTPEVDPININGCDACKNCDVLADTKGVSVECGKLSGDKTLNINYNKGMADRSIYRTLYVSFLNKNKKWIFTI